VNGKQSKALRKALAISKPCAEKHRGGVEQVYDEMGNPKLVWRNRSVPEMNAYRTFKRWYKQGVMK
jgi:hypothetical protein